MVVVVVVVVLVVVVIVVDVDVVVSEHVSFCDAHPTEFPIILDILQVDFPEQTSAGATQQVYPLGQVSTLIRQLFHAETSDPV